MTSTFALVLLLSKREAIEQLRTHFATEESPPHITLVYPFDCSEDTLRKKVSAVVATSGRFTLTLHGVAESPAGEYIHLLVEEGVAVVQQLRERLKAALSIGEDNPELPFYRPHLSLGRFATSSVAAVLAYARKQEVTEEFTVTAVTAIVVGTGEHIVFPLRKD